MTESKTNIQPETFNEWLSFALVLMAGCCLMIAGGFSKRIVGSFLLDVMKGIKDDAELWRAL